MSRPFGRMSFGETPQDVHHARQRQNQNVNPKQLMFASSPPKKKCSVAPPVDLLFGRLAGVLWLDSPLVSSRGAGGVQSGPAGAPQLRRFPRRVVRWFAQMGQPQRIHRAESVACRGNLEDISWFFGNLPEFPVEFAKKAGFLGFGGGWSQPLRQPKRACMPIFWTVLR